MIAEKAMHYEIFRTTNSVYFYIETFSITRTPDKTTVVVEGVNSTKVALFWMFSLNANESIRNIAFDRRRSGENDTRIATKRGNHAFTYADNDEIKANYVAQSSSTSATLVLVNVTNSEEYTYTLRLTYDDGNGRISRHKSSTFVVVYGE